MDTLRPTFVEIDIDNYLHNLKVVRELTKDKSTIMPILKGNAYGHEAAYLASEAVKAGVKIIGVSIVEEGILLREHDINIPIVILSGVYGEQVYALIRYNLSPVVFSRECLSHIEKAAKGIERCISVHLKIDTGMARLGIEPDKVMDIFSYTDTLRHVKIAGIMTHFAGSYMADANITLEQLKRFNTVIDILNKNKIEIEWIHAANSAAIIRYRESHYNMVRPGIMLYGVSPLLPEGKVKRCIPFSNISLNPVMTWKTRIISIKKVPKGTGVSYGHYFKTRRETLIGVLPIGYGDGYSRILSDKAYVIVRGKKARQIGKICMDLCMIDLTDIEGVTIGDEVIIMGKDANGEEVSVYDMAKWLGSIPYEVLTMVGSRVPRIYKKGGSLLT